MDVPSELERFRKLVGPLLVPRKIALLVDSLRRSVCNPPTTARRPPIPVASSKGPAASQRHH